MHLHEGDLQKLPRFFRANLVNSLSGNKPAMLVGTANEKQQTNLALFSNIFHVGADPALIGYVQRPVGQSGDTYRNIQATGHYSFNFVEKRILEKAHYTSARFPSELSEFDLCGFTPEWIEDFRAPFVRECQLKIGLSLQDIIPYPKNNTIFVIGSVEQVFVPDGILLKDGNLELDKLDVVTAGGLERYYAAHFIAQLPYAKADQPPPYPQEVQ